MQTKIIKNKCSMTRGKKVATSERRTSDKHPRRRNVFVTLWKYVPENMPEVQLRRVLENLRRCHLFPAAIGVSAVTGFSKLQEPAPIEETRSRREKRCGTGRTNALRLPMPSTIHLRASEWSPHLTADVPYCAPELLVSPVRPRPAVREVLLP